MPTKEQLRFADSILSRLHKSQKPMRCPWMDGSQLRIAIVRPGTGLTGMTIDNWPDDPRGQAQIARQVIKQAQALNDPAETGLSDAELDYASRVEFSQSAAHVIGDDLLEQWREEDRLEGLAIAKAVADAERREAYVALQRAAQQCHALGRSNPHAVKEIHAMLASARDEQGHLLAFDLKRANELCMAAVSSAAGW